MKTCFKCGAAKPIEEFYRHPEMEDGHLGKCKECTKRDVRGNRKGNLPHYRRFDAERASLPKRMDARKAYASTDRGREVHAASLKRSRVKYPEKALARYTVSNAIRGGKLQRMPCAKCGQKAQAHHEDYSRPLDVQWLCAKHHAERHRELRQAA